jgi:hypothetical protein
MRSSREVRAGWRGLLPCDAASYSLQLQPGILSGFYRSAYRLSDERRHLDPSLFDV